MRAQSALRIKQGKMMPRLGYTAWMLPLALAACIADVAEMPNESDAGVQEDASQTDAPTSTREQCGTAQQCKLPATTCGNRRIDPGEECDDGNADDTDACVDCKNAFCGDGHIQSGVEECEIGTGWRSTSNDDAWNTNNCNRYTCARLKYQPCTTAADCGRANFCAHGVCAPIVCPTGEASCQSYAEKCDGLPAHSTRIVDEMCFLECGKNAPCPRGLVCSTKGICVGDPSTIVN